MATKNSIPVELLKQLLSCDFETGKLTWLFRSPEMFAFGGYNSQQNLCNSWNTKFSGKPAFASKNSKGYFFGSILGKSYQSHRVIWALRTGAWSANQIDHIDCNPSNNAISNLREASASENQYNRGKTSTNKSGYKGVCWYKQTKKWAAQIKSNSGLKHLGYFDTPELAYQAYCVAAKRNHGQFYHE